MHVVVDGLARDLVGRLEHGPDVDVEAEVGERARHDLGAAVVPVLPELGHQDARVTPLTLAKHDHARAQRRPFRIALVEATVHALHSMAPPLVATKDLGQSGADFTEGGARAHRHDRGLEQVPDAGFGLRSERRQRIGYRARITRLFQGFEARTLRRQHRLAVDDAHVGCRLVRCQEAIDPHDHVEPAVDARLPARRSLLDAPFG